MNKIITIVVLVFVSFNSFSSGKEKSLAKVLKVKGDVTILVPHTTEARLLKEDEVIVEDSSIVTGANAFTKIEFFSKATVVIGPHSKFVLEPVGEETGATMISLLKGQLRSRVEKEIVGKEQKFFVKTRSAAIGVRGTEFQTIYEPQNMKTGLLTFNGEVAIKKIDSQTKLDTTQTFKNELKADVKLAKIGDYTSVSVFEKTATPPVKIDPTQLTLLKKDETQGVEKEKISESVLKEEVKKIEEIYKKEGITSKTQNKDQIRNLGFVDMKTGFYVPPREEKVTSDIGSVDMNGQYVPPKGILLDAKSGFIAEKKDDRDAQAKLAKLNSLIEKQKPTEEESKMYKKYFNTEDE